MIGACVSRTPLKNACGVPREMILRWFSNNWKWKDSHFHRGRVSKRFRMQAGPSTGLMEGEGSANFTVGFCRSFAQCKMNFLRLREHESLDSLVSHRKHYWLPAIDYSQSWFHCQIDEYSLKRQSLWGWTASGFIAAREHNQLQQSSELYSVDCKISLRTLICVSSLHNIA